MDPQTNSEVQAAQRIVVVGSRPASAHRCGATAASASAGTANDATTRLFHLGAGRFGTRRVTRGCELGRATLHVRQLLLKARLFGLLRRERLALLLGFGRRALCRLLLEPRLQLGRLLTRLDHAEVDTTARREDGEDADHEERRVHALAARGLDALDLGLVGEQALLLRGASLLLGLEAHAQLGLFLRADACGLFIAPSTLLGLARLLFGTETSLLGLSRLAGFRLLRLQGVVFSLFLLVGLVLDAILLEIHQLAEVEEDRRFFLLSHRVWTPHGLRRNTGGSRSSGRLTARFSQCQRHPETCVDPPQTSSAATTLGELRCFVYSVVIMRGAVMLLLASAGLASATGCVGAPGALAAGARCTRTSECGPGLLCNMGVCTTDRTGFGNGMVPVVPMDAGPVDAPLEPDAFVEGVDAFVEPVDAYVPPGTDAWAPDAWEPPVDAFTPPTPDAFTPGTPDAFTPPVDAFTPATPDAFVDDPDAFVEPDAAT